MTSSESPILLRSTRHCCCYGGRVARLDANITDRYLAGVHRGNSLFENAREIGRFGDRPKSDGALGAAHGGEVDFGVGHALPDPFVLNRAIARACHPLLVQFVIVE